MIPIHNMSGTICNRCCVIVSPNHIGDVLCPECAERKAEWDAAFASVDLQDVLDEAGAPDAEATEKIQAIMDAWADEAL